MTPSLDLTFTYSGIRSFYFDSIYIGVAIRADGIIVSRDAAFERIGEVRRICLEFL